MLPNDLNGVHWFVMRDVLPANAKDIVYKKLIEEGVEVFTPLKWEFRTHFSRRERVMVPVIYPLLFVHSSKATIRELQLRYPTLQFIYQRGETMHDLGMVVRDKEMRNFRIAVEMQKSPVFYQLDDIKPDMVGRKVLMINGPLKGCEGYLYRCRGRGQKLLIQLKGLVSTIVQVNKADFCVEQEADEQDNPMLGDSSQGDLRILLADITNILDVLGQKDVRTLKDEDLNRLYSAYFQVTNMGGGKLGSLPTIPSCQQMLQRIEAELTRRKLPKVAREQIVPTRDNLLTRLLSLCERVGGMSL